jgi:lambda family phage portal protein
VNLLDRAIAAVAPGAALRRAEARARLALGARGYAGAQHDPRVNWRDRREGPHAATGPYLARLRDRARQLVRDNPYAARIASILPAHQVGYGITPQPDTGNPTLDRQVAALWDEWVAAADATGGMDFYGLQQLVARTRVESGECLVLLRRPGVARTRALGLPLPLLVEVLEPDWIDDDRDTRLGRSEGQPLIAQGVELDEYGRRAALWLRHTHPGEAQWRTPGIGGFRVPAADVLHLYRVLRPGQLRGVTDFAPVLTRMQRLGEYEHAALEKANIEACLTAFVTSDAAAADGPLAREADALANGASPDGEAQVAFGSGMVNYLRPGETVETVTPTGAGGFEPFAIHALMAISAGAGCTYDQVTGDLRQANYSSLRAGKIEFRRLVQQDQWLMLIPRFCMPVWRAFIDAAILANRLPAGDYPVKWVPPPAEMVDPTREIPAEIAAIRAGLRTPQEAIGAMGEDWRKQVAEIAAWNAAIDDAGVILDTDPRRTANTGGAQDARQNAAIEIAATGAAAPRAPQPTQENE